MPELVLRPYQQAQFEAIAKAFRAGYRRVLISAPTGTGKMVLIVFVCHATLARGKRTLILQNTDELVLQAVEKLNRIGVEPGVVKRSRDEWDREIVVASVQTLARQRRLESIPPDHFQFIVVDECHFANAISYQRVLSYFRSVFVLGVSATLFRGDQESLAKAGWQWIAHVYTIQEAIRDGFLVRPVAYRIQTSLDLSSVPVVRHRDGRQDFAEEELGRQVNTVTRNATIVDAWLERSEGRRTVAFCVDVQHAFDLANAFRARGVDARALHGQMPLGERRSLVAAHRAGEFPIITNCAVLTHGYDDPAVGCVVMARPTQSKTLAVQCIGRGLRICPEIDKQDCVILDFVDMSVRHKLVTVGEVVELVRELREGVRDEVETCRVGPVSAEDENAQVKKKRRYSNEGDAEEWEARQIDLLREKERAREAKLAEPASTAQRRMLFAKLLRDHRWPRAEAIEAAFRTQMNKKDFRRFLAALSRGTVRPEQFPAQDLRRSVT